VACAALDCGALLFCSTSSAAGKDSGVSRRARHASTRDRAHARTFGNGQERLLHAAVKLGRGAKQRSADGGGVRLGLLGGHLPAALHVYFVARQHERDVLACATVCAP
jgi:hypothetical protein